MCFFAPPEVHRKILDYSLKSRDGCIQIETIDILLWAMHETCIQIEENLALWASHGIAYQARQSTSRCEVNSFNQESYISAWIEAEPKTLTEMYTTSNETKSNSLLRIIERKLNDDQLRSQQRELSKIKMRCENYQISSYRSTALEELQEREVAQSREYQREDPKYIELPFAVPYPHKLHPSLVQFIETSSRPLPPDTPDSPFRTLMQTLELTSFSSQIREDPWTSNILTTVDFSRSMTRKFDSIPKFEVRLETDLLLQSGLEPGFPLQPVTWIMSTRALNDNNHLTFIIISPFEANKLLPSIRKSSFVNLHMYSPRLQMATTGIFDLVSSSTSTFSDKQRSHSIHPEMEGLMIQLNLYAGELFFSSYDMYRKTCAFLGMCDMGEKQPTLPSIKIQRPPAKFRAGGLDDMHSGDGGTWASGNQIGAAVAQSKRNRWKFLEHLVKLRAGETKIEHTHMGCLLRGEMLQEKEWSKEGVDISPEPSDTEDISPYCDEDPIGMADANEELDSELIPL